MRRGITVGVATGGSTGQPLGFPPPGGGMAMSRRTQVLARN